MLKGRQRLDSIGCKKIYEFSDKVENVKLDLLTSWRDGCYFFFNFSVKAYCLDRESTYSGRKKGTSACFAAKVVLWYFKMKPNSWSFSFISKGQSFYSICSSEKKIKNIWTFWVYRKLETTFPLNYACALIFYGILDVVHETEDTLLEDTVSWYRFVGLN